MSHSLARRTTVTLAALLWTLVTARPVAADGPATASMTLVPAGPVSDQSRVETRVAIRNPTSQPKVYDVELLVANGSSEQTFATTQITVPPLGQQLYSAWLPAANLSGENTIRYRAHLVGGTTTLNDQRPFQVVSSATRAVPRIGAGWIEPGAVLPGVYPQNRPPTAQDVRNEVDAMHAVGMNTIIIAYSEFILNGWGAFYPSSLYPNVAGFDVVGAILNQASRNGQHVFVGLGRGNDLLLTANGLDDPQRLAAGLAHSQSVATELWNAYHQEPSFYGWYLTHEPNDIQHASAAFFNPLADFLHSFAADKPVMVAPDGTPLVTPSALQGSKVDVFVYQDAVGAGYVPYVYTFDPQQRIDTLDAVFSSYAAAHATTDKHLWADLELWQMDGPTYGNPYAATTGRVLTQLDIEKHHVDFVTGYATLGFLEDPASTLGLGGTKAANLYAGYRAYLGATAQTSSWLVDAAGTWKTPSNWDFPVPDTVQQTAVFGSAITTDRAVSLAGAATVRAIRFDNPHAYTIDGAGLLILQSSNGPARIDVLHGNHHLHLAVLTAGDTRIDVAADASLALAQTVYLDGQTLTKSGAGSLVLDALVLDGGTLRIEAGLLSGTAMIAADVVNVGGVLSPGDDLGPITIEGNYVQGSTAALRIVIAGTTPVVGHDALHVSGAADLAGTLEVTLASGYTPELGDTFTVLQFSTRSGSFTAYTGLGLAGGLALEPRFLADRLDLRTMPAQPGDINLDGTVNIFDINSVSSNWNTAGPQGDANGDGVINIFDVNLISEHWGEGTSAAVAPEPSAFMLIALGAVVMLVGRLCKEMAAGWSGDSKSTHLIGLPAAQHSVR